LNYSNYIIAGNFDRVTNPYPHPNPTDFAHKIRIRCGYWLAPSHPYTAQTVNSQHSSYTVHIPQML